MGPASAIVPRASYRDFAQPGPDVSAEASRIQPAQGVAPAPRYPSASRSARLCVTRPCPARLKTMPPGAEASRGLRSGPLLRARNKLAERSGPSAAIIWPQRRLIGREGTRSLSCDGRGERLRRDGLLVSRGQGIHVQVQHRASLFAQAPDRLHLDRRDHIRRHGHDRRPLGDGWLSGQDQSQRPQHRSLALRPLRLARLGQPSRSLREGQRAPRFRSWSRTVERSSLPASGSPSSA